MRFTSGLFCLHGTTTDNQDAKSLNLCKDQRSPRELVVSRWSLHLTLVLRPGNLHRMYAPRPMGPMTGSLCHAHKSLSSVLPRCGKQTDSVVGLQPERVDTNHIESSGR